MATAHAEWLSRRVSASPLGRVLVPVGLLVAIGLTALWAAWADHRLTDAHVYLGGGHAWLRGQDIYASMFPASYPNFYLPFTYPPIAAVLFAVLGWLPMPAALTLLIATSLAAGAVVIAHTLRELRPRLVTPTIVLLAALAAMALEPVRETVSFGQVNLILMALVTTDCLTRSDRWPRGVLIGIAAAIKLTPAAFVLFFIARGQWRPVGHAVGAFLGASALGLLLAPRDSRAYWLSALGDTNRVGQLAFNTNQSLRGVLERLDLPVPNTVVTVLWLGAAALVVAAAWTTARRAHLDGDRLGALVAVSAVPLLISPVSWSHHWVWVLPGLAWGLGRVRYSPHRLAAFLPVAAVFCYGPHWLYPSLALPGQQWAGWYNILGNAYVWVTLIALAVFTLRAPRPSSDGPGPAGGEAALVSVTGGTAR